MLLRTTDERDMELTISTIDGSNDRKTFFLQQLIKGAIQLSSCTFTFINLQQGSEWELTFTFFMTKLTRKEKNDSQLRNRVHDSQSRLWFDSLEFACSSVTCLILTA